MQLGALKIGKIFSATFINQMTTILKKTNPNIPNKAFKILKEEINSIIGDQMKDKGNFYKLVYPVYDKYLTTKDIKGLITFYKTPAGRKAISVMPQLTRESMIVGQQWGQSLAPIIQERILKRFEKEGIKIDKDQH